MSARAGLVGAGAASGEHGVRAPRPAALCVRAAGAGDLAPLTFFFDALLRRDYFLKRGQLADLLNGGRHRVLVAEIDAVLVGAAVLSGAARLINVLVHPAYRGLGIGRELVRQSGAAEVRAKADAADGDSRGFYQSLGFEATGQFSRKGNIEVLRLRGATGGPDGCRRGPSCAGAGRAATCGVR